MVSPGSLYQQRQQQHRWKVRLLAILVESMLATEALIMQGALLVSAEHLTAFWTGYLLAPLSFTLVRGGCAAAVLRDREDRWRVRSRALAFTSPLFFLWYLGCALLVPHKDTLNHNPITRYVNFQVVFVACPAMLAIANAVVVCTELVMFLDHATARNLRPQTYDPALPCFAEAAATCCICLDDFEAGESVAVLPCGHLFHLDCIEPWMASKRRCPLRCKAGRASVFSGASTVARNTDAQLPAAAGSSAALVAATPMARAAQELRDDPAPIEAGQAPGDTGLQEVGAAAAAARPAPAASGQESPAAPLPPVEPEAVHEARV